MKATALLTPLLVLGLLLVMPKLKSWARRPGDRYAEHHERGRPVPSPASTDTDDTLGSPLLRDPPPPPGYVEPLAGSSAEDMSMQKASSAQSDGRPISVSTPGIGL